jgi:hypothetical protein
VKSGESEKKRRYGLPDFTDKTALLLALMLSDPEKKWHIKDFKKVGVSAGRSSEILTALHQADLVTREYRGKWSHTALESPHRLVSAWTDKYSFALNRCYSFRSARKNVLNELKNLYAEEPSPPYLLTLHTGANLVAPYVKSDILHAYLEPKRFGKTLSSMTGALGLKQVIGSGNVCFYEPCYGEAVFWHSRSIRGYRVASNLQLYLDLFHHGLRGYEHAAHLKKTLEERGIPIWSD